MAKGFLKVNVYGENIANPIYKAKITILKNGEEVLSTYTNEDGQSDLIELETVDKSFSLEEQNNTRPYETYDVKVEALGLVETTIEGVQIFDGITSIQDIYLNSLDNNQSDNITKITPNTLWGDYPDNISLEESSLVQPIVLREVIIPSTIIVHDGAPSNTSVPNYTVPFIDYVKNVASSEVYSTWPRETIKANIIAIISFALNRIYTEWYRSKGYDFTITSTTTYDQKYTKNGTIFEPISEIVDEVFQNYIKKGVRMEPLLAHYRSNTSESGYLSQWGSKDLGDRGYSALQILKYYYGNDINIYEAEIREGYPYSFSGILQKGDCSIDVYMLQNALNYIRGSYPGIPLIEKPSGYFDDATFNAVKTFQKVFSLSQTGKVDVSTWYKISYILTAVKDLTQSVYS